MNSTVPKSRMNLAIRKALLIALSPFRRLGVRFPRQLTKHLHYRGVVSVRTSPGRGFRMQSYGHNIENNLYWYGVHGHEPEAFLLWLAASLKATVVLDIGANTALYSLAAAAQNPAAQVFAFEPLARIADLARHNASLNPDSRIEVCEVAVSDRGGKVLIYDPGGSQSSSASLRSDFLSCDTEPIEVATVRIDDFVRERQLESVDLIKLDVEGVEEAALRGMRATMERFRPHLFMEFLDDRPELLTEIGHLQSIGYRCVGLTRHGATLLDDPTAEQCERNLLLTTQPDQFLARKR